MAGPEIFTIETQALGDRSYVVANGATAAVIDRQRDIGRIDAVLAERGLRLTRSGSDASTIEDERRSNLALTVEHEAVFVDRLLAGLTGWDAHYRTTDLVWTANSNQFLVAEGDRADARHRVGPRGRGESQGGVACPAGLAAHSGRLLRRRPCQRRAARGQRRRHAHHRLRRGWRLRPPSWRVRPRRRPVPAPAPPPARAAVHRRAAHAVAAGGTLLVVGHDTTNLTSDHGGPQDPVVLLSPDDVVADLSNSGLVIDRAERVHRSVETADGERMAIDALVRAQRPEQP